MKYGFIGIGNMCSAILNGLLNSGALDKRDTLICGRNYEKTLQVAEKLGVKAIADQCTIIKMSDIFFLGVEPKDFKLLMPTVAKEYNNNKICISMAAGITIDYIESIIGSNAKIIRIMPNTPAKVSETMVSVSRNANITDKESASIISLLSTMGKAVEIPEDLIHAVVGVSGSSPAYTYMYINALVNIAETYGMTKKQARIFAAQSVLGAAKLVLSTSDSLESLVNNVCSPGGATLEAVEYLQRNGFMETVEKAAEAAVKKSISMSKFTID